MIPEHSQLFVEMGDEISSRQYIADLHTTFGLLTFLCCISLIAKGVERHRLVSVDVRRSLYHSQPGPLGAVLHRCRPPPPPPPCHCPHTQHGVQMNLFQITCAYKKYQPISYFHHLKHYFKQCRKLLELNTCSEA